MKPVVSIIMGSTSDLPVMEKAAKFFDEMEIPFEMNALSAHRTPAEVEAFAKEAAGRGLKVIIAGAGMAAALPGVIAANTTLPVIGVPIKGMLDGLDAMLSIIQMPPGIPVATVGVCLLYTSEKDVQAVGEHVPRMVHVRPKHEHGQGCEDTVDYSQPFNRP